MCQSRRWFTSGAIFLMLAHLSAAVLFAQQPSSGVARAVRLFKNRQYGDAIRILEADIKGKTDKQCAQQHLLLGNEDDPEAQSQRVIEIYDVRDRNARCEPLTRSYGSLNSVHGSVGSRSAMLYSGLGRVEEIGGIRVLWAEGIDKMEKQAQEFGEFPRLKRERDYSCAEVLDSVLEGAGLRCKIVERAIAADLYEAAKDQFNKIRQIDPKSEYGERSLFALAINFYHLQDYDKMKIVLREYLKLFDNPSFPHYQQACFWVGWTLERESRYREACNYYMRAAEERLVVYRPKKDETLLTKDQFIEQLSYDLHFKMAEPVSGRFEQATLSDFADFVRLNTLIDVRLDPSTGQVKVSIDRDAFKQSLSAAGSAQDRLSIRDGYAKALFRAGDQAEALGQFQTLIEDETDPLRKFVARQMVFLLRFLADEVFEREFPEHDLRFIHAYEQLTDAERGRLPRAQLAKAMERFEELLRRYPVSPYVEQIKKAPAYQQWKEKNARSFSGHLKCCEFAGFFACFS